MKTAVSSLLVSTLAFLSQALGIEWVACPEGQIYSAAHVWDCAYLSFHMDRDDPSKGNVSSFVRRGYVQSPTEKSVWGIAGGPGLTTHGFVPMFDYFMTVEPTLTSYLVDARGTGQSSPLHRCSSPPPYLDPYNATLMKLAEDCNQEMIAADTALLSYFTTYNAAQDLAGVLQAVAPTYVSVYASSYGTFFANTFLQLPGVRADVVIYDGPVTPNRWPMENNAAMQSMVAFDGIRMCVEESSVCRRHLGEMGHLPSMTKDAIVDRVLPCLSRVPWLAAENGNFLTSIYNNFMNPNFNKALLGPFWHRLHRCSDSDVEQLTFFNAARRAEMDMWNSDNPQYSLGYAINAALADLYSMTTGGVGDAKSYAEVVASNERTFVVEGGDLTTSFARSESHWPVPPAHPLSRAFAAPAAPLHIFVGTLDANTPVGQAQWLLDNMNSSVDITVHVVPYAHHGIVDPSNTCAAQMVASLLALQPQVDSSCLPSSVPQPDWDGSDDATRKGISLQWFGTEDLWNNGQLVDDPVAVSDDDCSWTKSDVRSLMLVTAVPLAAVIAALAVCVLCLARRLRGDGGSLLGAQRTKQDSAM